MRRLPALLVVVAALAGGGLADGPKDNVSENVRPVPPKGIAVPAEVRAKLTADLAELKRDLDALPGLLAGKPELLALVPDAEVFHKAVHAALVHDEFYTPKEIAAAPGLVKQGRDRAASLARGDAPWKAATGLVVRGYRSKIDGSVQPYGLVVPKDLDRTKPARLDCWWHGRGETLSEVAFVMQRQSSPGEFTPAGAIVLHPYGRYCNANKFAGEVDTFEAIAAVKRDTEIDPDRVVARGFSMGGAACWQFATHFPGYWAAAAPGAGFSETPDFLKVFQNEKVTPTWYEQRLWHLYNATDYAANLTNLPTVAYSGEVDKQKQAADKMAEAMKAEGLELVHIIGPKTAHKYEPGAKADISKRVDAIVAKGRRVPTKIAFTTWTLRYPESHWVRVEGLGRHWQRARVNAEVKDGAMTVTTENVTVLTIRDVKPATDAVELTIDGQAVPPATRIALKAGDRSGPSVTNTYQKKNGRWGSAWDPTARGPDPLLKVPGLQGPIDDAFYDRFIFVCPTGTPLHAKTGAWVDAEMKRAVDQWRKQFRGDAVVVDDTAVTPEMIANANLVLWGDPQSNKLFARVADKLPVKVTAAGLTLGDKTYPADTHVPVLIYPNPLNPAKYVVLNSGFTFREYDYLSNARQVPRLPDYAVIDVTTPPTARAAGKVVRAGFFGENWEFLPKDGE